VATGHFTEWTRGEATPSLLSVRAYSIKELVPNSLGIHAWMTIQIRGVHRSRTDEPGWKTHSGLVRLFIIPGEQYWRLQAIPRIAQQFPVIVLGIGHVRCRAGNVPGYPHEWIHLDVVTCYLLAAFECCNESRSPPVFGLDAEFPTYRPLDSSLRSAILAFTSLVLTLILRRNHLPHASQLGIPSNRLTFHQVGLVV
jgi:hypothetical protein